MNLPRLCCLGMLAAALAAQTPDPFTGSFEGDRIRMKLQLAGKVYSGTVEYQQNSLAVSAGKLGKMLIGTLTIKGQSFPMQIVREREGLLLTTNGETYRMHSATDKPTEAAPGKTASPAASEASGVRQELVGKWCYLSNANATNGGGRTSSQCFVLAADGRYEYSGQTDSSNPNGGASSQTSDRGTWAATDTTITSRSVSGRVSTYRLEKRNHPKNSDPMLVIEGQAYVTYYNKPAW